MYLLALTFFSTSFQNSVKNQKASFAWGLFLLLGLSGMVRAQSIDSSSSFYPLHVGDKWEFDWRDYVTDPPSHYYYQRNEVLCDTTMANGQRYFTVQRTNLYSNYSGITFERIDSLTGYVHMWNGTLDLATDINLRTASVGQDTIFGLPAQVRWTGSVGAMTQLAYGIGVVAQTEEGQGWPYRSTILYARIDGVEHGVPLSVKKLPTVPEEFVLAQNFPNPFNPSTTIRFNIPSRSRVRLTIFNLLGQEIAELANEEMNAGSCEKTWNANVASGMYFYRIEAVSVTDGKRFVDVKKMLLLK